jgi:hypothetical protein
MILPGNDAPTNAARESAAGSTTVATAAAAAPASAPAPFSMPALRTAMLRSSAKISDLFFSPGKPPLVEVNGRLAPVGARTLTPEDTRHIASELIGNNKHAPDNLRDQGSCAVSYSLPGSSRFRVNVFMPRGTCAIVMRVIPTKIPSFAELHLPTDNRIAADRWMAQRDRSRDRADRVRQVLDAGGHHRLDQ